MMDVAWRGEGWIYTSSFFSCGGVWINWVCGYDSFAGVPYDSSFGRLAADMQLKAALYL